MNRKLLVAVVSGAVALPMAAAVQADASVYGSLRYGVAMTDSDANSSTLWDLGSNRSSRWGIKGATEISEGLTGGFQIERNLNASMSARHHNVYVQGEHGTIKLGQQGSPYYSASAWDGAQTLGGETDPFFRSRGMSFSSSLGGPFDFQVLLGSNPAPDAGDGDGADHVEIGGSLAAGPISFSLGYMQQVDDGERVGGTVSGSVVDLNWKVGYEAATDITCTAAMAAIPASVSDDHDDDGSHTMTPVTPAVPAVMCDEDRYGVHVGYGIGGGTAFAQYTALDSDVNARDQDYWILGYSQYLSDSVTVYGEFRTRDLPNNVTENKGVVAVKVDF